MIRRQPIYPRTDNLFPYTPLCLPPPDPSETVDRSRHAHLSFSNLLGSRRSRDENEIGPFLGVRLLGRSALHACNDLGGDLLRREAEILVEVARRRRRAEAVDAEAQAVQPGIAFPAEGRAGFDRDALYAAGQNRPGERRIGKERVRKFSTGWSP